MSDEIPIMPEGRAFGIPIHVPMAQPAVRWRRWYRWQTGCRACTVVLGLSVRTAPVLLTALGLGLAG